ncbi:MAG: hypothetical protein JXR84_27180 [Anaerolineae bacterium]|nr:hypothetical protein [Anaerolineae bacterium]
MSAICFYLKVIKALEEMQAPYLIVGAFAGLAFGVTRATFDVDILVDLHDEDFEALAAQFPLPRYYFRACKRISSRAERPGDGA